MTRKGPRAIAELGEGGETKVPLYNRGEQRLVERALRRLAKRKRRGFWKFPPAA